MVVREISSKITVIFSLLILIVLILAPNARADMEPADITFESGYLNAFLFDERGLNHVGYSSSFARVTGSADRLGIVWSFAGACTIPDGEIRIDDNAGFSGFIGDNKPRFRVAISALPSGIIGPVSFYLNARQAKSVHPGFSLSIKPCNLLKGNFDFKRDDIAPESSRLMYKGEGGNITWQAPVNVSRLSLSSSPLQGLTLSTYTSRSTFLSSKSDEHYNQLGYRAGLEGIFRDAKIKIAYESKSLWVIAGEYRSLMTDLQIHGFLNGRQFSHFGELNLNGDIYGLRFTRANMELGFSSCWAEGKLIGTIKAWPFVDSLARFLGERRHFVGEGNIKWKHIYLADRIYHKRNFSIQSRIDYLSLTPDIKCISWRPALLGFGIDDLKKSEAPIKNADLLRLKMGIDFNLGRWNLFCCASQWIPIHISRKSKSDVSDGGSSTTARGGFILSIGLTANH